MLYLYPLYYALCIIGLRTEFIQCSKGKFVPPTYNIQHYLQAFFALRRFLKETLSLEQCKEIVKIRLEERGKTFINIVKRNIYGNDRSPYLRLLGLAGCEFGDFRSSVLKNGIEKTLEMLRESGVYLTYDEFKGRKDVVRGGKTFGFEQCDFNNTSLSQHLTIQTGGTTGPGVEAAMDFKSYSQTAVDRALLFDIYNLWEVPIAIWFPILPGCAGIGHLLHSTKVGKVPSKWFSQIDSEYMKSSFKHTLRTKGVIYAGRLFGTKFPKPEFVDLNSAVKVAKWIAKMIRDYSGCCVATYPSSAIRICHAANKEGLDISGTKFIVAGEPVTHVRLNEIKSAGAEAIVFYSFAEGGTVGYGCANPIQDDEVHLLKDCVSLVHHKRRIQETNLTVDAFLFTSLLPTTRKILLNVEIGDYGVVESRKCNCGFDDLGFNVHVHNVRSFEKLTSEGMNIVNTHLIRIIEEVLPSKYGGDSTDYQILEEEDERGFIRVNVIVSPTVGAIDEKDLLRTVISKLNSGEKNTFVPKIFSQADTLCVKRVHPISTEMGKILPLNIRRNCKQS